MVGRDSDKSGSIFAKVDSEHGFRFFVQWLPRRRVCRRRWFGRRQFVLRIGQCPELDAYLTESQRGRRSGKAGLAGGYQKEKGASSSLSGLNGGTLPPGRSSGFGNGGKGHVIGLLSGLARSGRGLPPGRMGVRLRSSGG